jgi:hypothetical protein
MKKDMKNKIIFILIFMCNNVSSFKACEINQQIDSIDKKITVWIEQDKEKEHIIKLFVRNEQLDTLVLRSSFTLDNPQRISHILIYSCERIIELDSVVCDWREPSIEEGETLIEYANRKVFIPTKNVVSFEIPIRRSYIETEVYFKVKLLFIYKKNVFVFEKETNKIYVERLNEK